MQDAELVELFEYKVADMQRGAEPKGGKRALSELRERLLGDIQDASLTRRIRMADRIWRTCSAAAAAPAPLQGGGEQGLDDMNMNLSDLPLGEGVVHAAGTDRRNEWDVLSRLRAGLYHAELLSQAKSQARAWLKEPRLATLRLAFALTENLERGAPGTAVPPLNDAFSSLHRPEIAAQVLTSLAEQLSVQAGELPERYLQVRTALSDLVNAPFPRSSNADVMDARVQAAEREQLSNDVKSALIQALQQGPDAPRSAAEQAPIREAAGRLLGFLESIIPRSSGGQGPEWPLLDGLLFARGQSLRLSEPGAQSLSLAIHLPGGEQTIWRTQLVAWKPVVLSKLEAETGWEVRLSDGGVGSGESINIVRLSAQRPVAESHLGGQPVRLVLNGEDMALELRPVSHTDLFPLSLEARLTASLLEPGQAYGYLRLARAAAQRLRGNEINAEKVSVGSAARYTAAPPETLLTFARQGAQTLLAYASQGEDAALERAFEDARTFLQLGKTGSDGLLNLVRRSLQLGSLPISTGAGVPEVESGEEYALLIFRGEPLTVKVRGRVVTLRNDYKGDLCAVMPGLPAAAVRDLLVMPLPNGAMTLIRAGERVAVGFQPLLSAAPSG